MPLLNRMNNHIKMGFKIEIVSKVGFLPILSDKEPARKVPAAPANCNTESEIPARKKDSPLLLR